MSPALSRRSVIAGLGAASAAFVAPIALAASRHQAARQQSAQERFDLHLAGLKAAIRELNPAVTAWAGASQKWGYGAEFLLVGASDDSLAWGDTIGGCFPLKDFTHDRLGKLPAIEPASYWTADDRYAAMTERQSFYRRWLGLEVVS